MKILQIIEQVSLADIKPPTKKVDEPSSMEPSSDDKLLMDAGLHLSTLSMVGKLRRDHEKKRTDDEKRLRVVKRIYRKRIGPSSTGGA